MRILWVDAPKDGTILYLQGARLKAFSRIAVALLACWLLIWIVVYRFSILDDSLIHLRYADFLRRVHFITFDGVHRTFGTSSLLFVGLLAALRGLFPSPLLPRAVSSVCHLVLFAAVARMYLRASQSSTPRVRMLGLLMLFLLVPLSAIRWMDDGMETSLVLCAVCLTAWWVHRLSLLARIELGAWLGSFALGFGLVLLRNELGVVDLLGVTMLVLAAAGDLGAGWATRLGRAVPARCALLVGGMVTALAIRLTMHSFLPDTALAKSHGIGQFGPSIGASEQVMAGSLIFGMGAFAAWLLSAAMALRQQQTRLLPTLAANALFPMVLLASAVRGQEIQGVRYLIWTFFFSILWNFLELRRVDETFPAEAIESGARLWKPQVDSVLVGALLVLALVAIPVDTRLMRRILSQRGETTRLFMSSDLAGVMHGETGVAYDIGYIAYFTGAPMCDMSGLVNGPGPAALTSLERARRCAAEHPDFAYLNQGQDHPLATFVDLTGWIVCGQYDLPNIRTTDRHFLLVKPDNAAQVCAANHFTAARSPYR